MNYILIIFFSIRTLHNLLYHLFWWERKEYRFSRMLVHLRETDQGKHWLFHPLAILKLILLILWLFLSIPNWQEIISYAVLAVYAVEGSKSAFQFKNGWRKPPFRPRAIGIFTGAIAFSAAVFTVVNPLSIYLSVLAVDKLLGPMTAFLVFLSNIYFVFHKKVKIEKARQKIKDAKNLKVVGITGSYGKTTAKEFTAQLLSAKYKVLKTAASQNSDIGIAELILRTDLSKYEYFVCEMAAYGRKEIAAICSMFSGKIIGGIITGINEQHQSLFKSLECAMKSKFELIEAVNDGGFAFFNAANKYCKNMSDWAVKRGLKAELITNKMIKKYKLDVVLPGVFLEQNLSLAIAAGKACGMTDADIRTGVKSIRVPDKTMNVFKKGAATVIDDSFNANPNGVYNALNYLASFKEKKILALQPLIELGKYADEVHEKIGKMAAEICDEIWLANINFNKSLMRGINKAAGGAEKVKYSASKNLENTVILFEGKESDKFMKEIAK